MWRFSSLSTPKIFSTAVPRGFDLGLKNKVLNLGYLETLISLVAKDPEMQCFEGQQTQLSLRQMKERLPKHYPSQLNPDRDKIFNFHQQIFQINN